MNRVLVTLTFAFGLFCSAFGSLNDVLISEVCINNDTTLQNELGDYADWFELYNSGASAVSLNDLYLSDDKDQLLKHQITDGNLTLEPGQYLLLWADGETTLGSHHVDFKLSKGERLTLFTLTDGIIDTVTFIDDKQDISYGRQVLTHNNNWMYYPKPTPGKANGAGVWGYASAVKFNVEGGAYSSAQYVTFSANPSEHIFYTLDNSDPDSSGIMYDGSAVDITTTTILRARAYRQGYFPGEIVSHSYMVNETSNLPVWCVITDPENLTGSETGIYSHPWSEGIEWERFSQHQYFVDGKLAYGGNSGIRIQGGNSVGMAKKSFRLHYRENYGDNRLEHPLFRHAGVSSFKQIVLKSGYDDDLTVSKGTLLKDPFSMEMWRLTGNLASASEWATLRLNEQYWGIYNLRESVDEDFIEDHMGTNNFDMIRYQKTGPEVKHGSMAQWDSLTTFFNTTDFTQEAAYDEAAKFIDMDNFLNLLAFVHCTQYRSWTWGASAYKGYKKNDRWRWTIWDTDRSFLDKTWNGFSQYALTSAEKWGNFMPQKLLKNNRFKEALINRTADFLNSKFRSDMSVEVLDSIKDIIAPEIANEQARWNSSQNWESNVESMRAFLRERPYIVRNQMLNYFSLQNIAPVTVDVIGKGKVDVNSLTITDFPWFGIYFQNVPITLTATPANGYKFDKWSNGSTDYTITTFTETQTDTVLFAYFVEDTSSVSETVVVNEIMYHPSDLLPSGDWIELYSKDEAYNLSGWWITDENDDNKFVFPLGTYIDADAYLVVAQSLSEFSAVHDTTGVNVVGGFGDGLSGFGFGNGGDCVKLYNLSGKLVDSVCYNDKIPWPLLADGYGYSMQLLNTNIDNSLPASWGISPAQPFTPGTLNFTTVSSVAPVVLPMAKIYPNPVRRVVQVELIQQAGNNLLLSLYSITGRLLLQEQVYCSSDVEIVHFNLEQLPQGSYLLKIASPYQIITNKIIKQ